MELKHLVKVFVPLLSHFLLRLSLFPLTNGCCGSSTTDFRNVDLKPEKLTKLTNCKMTVMKQVKVGFSYVTHM